MGECSSVEGGLVVLGAVMFFGSFALFIKVPAVMKLRLDPIVFQCYKSFWVVVSCWLALLFRPFQFTAFGIISGLSWVPAGVAAVITVRSIGISVGEGIWSGLIVVVNCFWGLLIFRESVGNAYMTLPGIGLLLVGVVGMSQATVLGRKLDLVLGRKNKRATEPLLMPEDVNVDHKQLHDNDNENDTENDNEEGAGKYPRWVGFVAAVFNGLWGGSIYAPMKIAKDQGVKTSGLDYIISFGIGVAIVQITMLLVYGIIRVSFLRKPFFPEFHFSTLWWAGSGAGLFWSIGNYFSLLAVLCFGEAVGYSSCQASLLVSGLWGVFYFGEIRGGAIGIFFAAAVATVGGVFLMVFGRDN